MKGIKLSKLTEKLNLQVIEKSTNYEETFITNPEETDRDYSLQDLWRNFPIRVCR